MRPFIRETFAPAVVKPVVGFGPSRKETPVFVGSPLDSVIVKPVVDKPIPRFDPPKKVPVPVIVKPIVEKPIVGFGPPRKETPVFVGSPLDSVIVKPVEEIPIPLKPVEKPIVGFGPPRKETLIPVIVNPVEKPIVGLGPPVVAIPAGISKKSWTAYALLAGVAYWVWTGGK